MSSSYRLITLTDDLKYDFNLYLSLKLFNLLNQKYLIFP